MVWLIDVIPYDEVAGEVVSDGAECVGVLADHVLAEQGVDAADYPDGADEDLVQHGELVAVLTALLTLRPAVHKTWRRKKFRKKNSKQNIE